MAWGARHYLNRVFHDRRWFVCHHGNVSRALHRLRDHKCAEVPLGVRLDVLGQRPGPLDHGCEALWEVSLCRANLRLQPSLRPFDR